MHIRTVLLLAAALSGAAQAQKIGDWALDISQDKITDKAEINLNHLENGSAISFRCSPLNFGYYTAQYVGFSGHYQEMLFRIDADKPLDFEADYNKNPHAVLWYEGKAKIVLERLKTAKTGTIRVFDYNGQALESSFTFSPETPKAIEQFQASCPDAR